MKIIPSKNYRKPLYAAGLAAIMLATAATGCTDIVKVEGDVPCETTEEVALAGDVAVIEPDGTCETKETKETEEIVELDGEVAVEDIK